MKEKIIFSDVDDVVFKWLDSFTPEILAMGYVVENHLEYDLSKHFNVPSDIVADLVKKFNESDKFANLPHVDESVRFIPKICEDFDYKFFFLSACGEEKSVTHDLRVAGIEAILGREHIHSIVCVKNSDAKREFLEKYRDKNYLWIEDNIKNALLGHELGFDSYLYKQRWNAEHNTHLKTINSWEEIYNIISKRDG